MGTTADKLNHLINIKEGIRQEINRAYNTEEISTSDTFNSYIQKLEEHPFYLHKYIEGTVENIKLSNATSIGDRAFYNCSNLTSVSFPNATSISSFAFYNTNLTSVSFPKVTSIDWMAFGSCGNLTTIYVGTNTSAVCTLSNTNAFDECPKLTNIYVPASLVDSYKSATNWSTYASKIKPYEQPVECITLSITADDVEGSATSTTVYYTAECTYTIEGVLQSDTKVFTGKGVSESFAQNTSTTNTVQRTVSFTFLGKTATTTITQGVWINRSISVTTSGISDYGWATADQYNVDGYDAYASNTTANRSKSVMKLECTGYSNITIYIRSNSPIDDEDYTIASNANASTYPTGAGSSTTKAHTRTNSNFGTALSDYTAVNYTGLSGNNDIIYIVYVRGRSPVEPGPGGLVGGFVLIPKQS